MVPWEFEVMHSSNEWEGGSPHVWLMFLFYTEKIGQDQRNKAAAGERGWEEGSLGRGGPFGVFQALVCIYSQTTPSGGLRDFLLSLLWTGETAAAFLGLQWGRTQEGI